MTTTARRFHVVPEVEDPIAPRELAAFAAACLLLDDAGVIDGGARINRRRCEQLVDELWARGIVASESETEAAVLGLMVELGAVAR